MLAKPTPITRFDLENEADRSRLANPMLTLAPLKGLVVLDEAHLMPSLYSALRVLVDRPENAGRFLILGSASPSLVRGVSESLAGRVEYVELYGFDLQEVGGDSWETLWIRGGFPRSFLARTDEDSVAWREGFVRSFLERDVPQLGISIPAAGMRRFWTMLAHFHGQTWNSSKLARSMGLSDKTVRSWLDILTGAYLVRQLQPWHVNVAKRQVKAPKVYLRDTGLLHALLGLSGRGDVLGHPQAGASWEGFALEQVMSILGSPDAYFWSTHGGASMDLLLQKGGRWFGMEFKFTDAPAITRSMRVAIEDLSLAHLFVLHAGANAFAMDEGITAWPISRAESLPAQIESALRGAP
jgi:predicted AAA+ superfamily ATPase